MPEERGLRVLVVDDHSQIRAGVLNLLESVDGIALVVGAADGHEALHMADRSAPDVVLMDVAMPGLSGVEVTRRLVAAGSSARVLVHSADDSPAVVRAAREAGAAGFIVKSGRAAILVSAIRVVGAGGSVWPAQDGA